MGGLQAQGPALLNAMHAVLSSVRR